MTQVSHPEWRYRLYTASVGERAQVLNAPFSELAYIVNMTRDRPPAGTYNRTIPFGNWVAAGFYLIHQCPTGGYHGRSCPSNTYSLIYSFVILNTNNQLPRIVIDRNEVLPIPSDSYIATIY